MAQGDREGQLLYGSIVQDASPKKAEVSYGRGEAVLAVPMRKEVRGYCVAVGLGGSCEDQNFLELLMHGEGEMGQCSGSDEGKGRAGFPAAVRDADRHGILGNILDCGVLGVDQDGRQKTVEEPDRERAVVGLAAMKGVGSPQRGE